MKKFSVLLMGLLLPMLAAAQTVKSPNGNVCLTFSLSDKGQPTYEMSYKERQSSSHPISVWSWQRTSMPAKAWRRLT